MHRVLKTFHGSDRQYLPREAVDASTWATREFLEREGYIRNARDRTDYECEVLKPFHTEDGEVHPGDRVNTKDWRLRDRLIEQRFIRPCSESKPTADPEMCGALTASGKPCTRLRKPDLGYCGLRLHKPKEE